MHDLSKAEEIVEKIEQEFEKDPNIKEVQITLGVFSFIDPQRFEYWLRNLLEEKDLSQIPVTIKTDGGAARCTSCNDEFSSDMLHAQLQAIDPHHPILLCPRCNEPTLDLTSGTDVLVSFQR